MTPQRLCCHCDHANSGLLGLEPVFLTLLQSIAVSAVVGCEFFLVIKHVFN